MDVVLYGKSDCPESETLRRYLDSCGVVYRMKVIDADGAARQEWEDLDGEASPLIAIDSRRFIRGLDRTRLDQALGFIGC
jgi:glutaredoxin